MHVAIVCRGLGESSSVAAVALRQARELARHARVTLVSDSVPAGCDLPHVAVRVPNLHALRRFRHVFDEVAFARDARRALATLHDVDVVLAHSHAIAYLAARRAGVPFALFVHGDIFERPPGTYDARLTAFYRWVTPRAYATAGLVIVLSSPFVEIVRRHGAANVELLPNGIDPEEIGPAGTREPHERFRIVSVGRLAVEKGLDDLLDACALLDIDYELTIVGSGPLEGHLRARANDRVHFTGAQPRTSLGAIYAANDLFCTAAVSEPFGNVVVEALVCGLPVVGTRVGGIAGIVQPGVNGLLVPPRDPRALADAITTIAGDPALRARLAAGARDSVLPRFAWDEVGARLLAALQRLAGGSTSPSARATQ